LSIFIYYNMRIYKQKFLKYKQKLLNLQNQVGGRNVTFEFINLAGEIIYQVTIDDRQPLFNLINLFRENTNIENFILLNRDNQIYNSKELNIVPVETQHGEIYVRNDNDTLSNPLSNFFNDGDNYNITVYQTRSSTFDIFEKYIKYRLYNHYRKDNEPLYVPILPDSSCRLNLNEINVLKSIIDELPEELTELKRDLIMRLNR